MRKIQKFLQLEMIDDEQQGRVLWMIIAALIPLSAALIILGLLTDASQGRVILIALTLLGWPIGAYFFLRARRINLAAMILVYGLAIASFIITIILGGLYALSYFAYVNVIFTSGLVLNRRHIMILTAAGIVGYLGIYFLERFGILTTVIPTNPLVIWVATSVIFLWTAFILLAFIRINEQSMKHTQQEVEERRLTEAQLARLAAVVEQSSESILITDTQGKISYVNPNFEHLTGYTSADVLGQNPRILKSGIQDDALYEELWKTVQNGEAWNGVLINRKRSGEFFHDEKSIFAIRNAGGEIINFAAVGRDITQRIAAEQRLRHYAGRMEILHKIEQAILQARGPEDIAITTLNQLHNLILFQRASMVLFDEKANTALVFAVDSTQPSELSPGLRLPLSHFTSLPQLNQNKHYMVEDLLSLPEPTLIEKKLIGEGIRAYLNTPLTYQNRLIGSLNIGKAIPGIFDPDTVTIVREVGNMLAVAIQNARLFEETQLQARQLGSLYETALDLASTLEIRDLVNRLSGQIHMLLAPDGLCIAIFEHNHETLKVLLAVNAGRPLIKWEDREISQTNGGLVGWVAHNQRSLLLSDLQENVPPADPLDIERDARSWLGVPMVTLNRVVGVVSVQSNQASAFSERQQKFLTSLAAQAAVTLENARLFEAERRRSNEKSAVASLSSAVGYLNKRSEILAITLNQVTQLTKCQNAAFLMRNPEPDGLTIEIAKGTWTSLTGMKLLAGEIVVGLVANLRRTYMIRDSQTEDNLLRRDLLGDVNALIFIPLIPQIDSLGFLVLGHIRAFSTDEVQILEALAEITATAIQRTNMFEQTQRRLGQVLALHQIDQAITTTIELDVILRVVLEQVTSQLRADAATVLLVDKQSQSLEMAVRHGFKTGALEHSHLKIGESYAGRAALSQQIIHVPDLMATPGEFNRAAQLAYESFMTYYAVPLVTKGEVKGVMELFMRQDFEPDDEWYTFLKTLAVHAAVAIDNSALFRDLQRSHQELVFAYDHTLEGWSKALELRDQETEGHSRRVTDFTLSLARTLGISEQELTHIRRGALLHDIGKMGISDQILLKSGPLNIDEWQQMRNHPVFAYQLLSPIPFLQPALDIPYSHHERWDGSGYPLGLKGEEIPLAARIFAVIDVYDALISDRPYRPAWSSEQAKEYLHHNAGTLFDPKIVNAFLELAQQY